MGWEQPSVNCLLFRPGAVLNRGWTPLTSSTTSAEAEAPQLSGSRSAVGATWYQPPKGGWCQRDQLTFSSTLLRYLVWPKFSDPNLLSFFFSLLKFAAPFLIILTLIILLILCGDIESNPGPTLGDGYTPNASSLLGFGDLSDGPFCGIDIDCEHTIEDTRTEFRRGKHRCFRSRNCGRRFPRRWGRSGFR